jgi:hypothetical protein
MKEQVSLKRKFHCEVAKIESEIPGILNSDNQISMSVMWRGTLQQPFA